jgi:quercetin dioxygenase-like cupin family protein
MESVRIHLPGDFEWRPVIDGAEMAVLDGDPAKAVQYVIRFRTHREIFVPLHWHREDEHVTVLAGPFSLSLDNALDKVSDQALDGERRELAPGSYAVIPAGVHHSAWYGAGTVVQVSGIGPFESIYVDPASDLGDRITKRE